MNLEAVKERLYDITDMFFKGATIIWAEQINTKPPLPYIVLKTGDVRRNAFPVTSESGTRYYHCRTILEANLYTKGKPVTIGKNVTGNFANTAVTDMSSFCNFIESESVVDILSDCDMDVSLIPPVRDLTELQNDRNYRYRSMAEFEVSFIEEADGMYGVLGVELPNYSGGGTEEMAAREIEPIESVEIQYNKEVEDGI